MRARDLRPRLVFSVFVAMAGVYVSRGAWPYLWLATTVGLQLLSLVITEPARRNPAFRFSPRRERLFFLAIGFSSAVFASAGVLFWFDGGSGGRLFALTLLAGGIVNVALQAGPSMRRLTAGSAPFVVILQALPLISLWGATGEARQVMILTAFGSALIILHLAAAAHRTVRESRNTQAAIEAARRESERAEAASAAKSDFLGVMSHELRTPLNGVLGMAQAMEAEALDYAQRARLDVIRQSGESLLLLLNDLLDISKIETAKLELETAAIDLEAIVVQAQAVFGPLAAGKALNLEVRLLASAGAARLGDATRVRQVLHNLIGNAIKFTETGRIDAVISGSGDQLVIEVSDTGPGVAPERLGSLFERFSVSDSSATRRHGGSGLGLAIARGLARLMGGDILVRSSPGLGSTFIAWMQLPPTEAPAAVAEAEGCALDLRLRVLAAEDNPTNQLVLRALLEQLGLSVHIVENGAAAVEAYSASAWDLVLMDIQMPVMDGLAATRAIRALEAGEDRPRTPIIAVTANSTAQQAAEYMAAGMDGLAPKPIQLSQLLAVIRDVVGAAAAAEPEAQSEARSAAA